MLAVSLAVACMLSPAEVLWYRLGVPVGSVRMQRLQRTVSQTWRDRAVFVDAALLDRRVAALESALGPSVARLVVLRAPLVLTSPLEDSLHDRIRTLASLLPGIDVVGLVARAPALLELDFETAIEPRVRKLEAMLPKEASVVRTVRRMPSLLHLADLDQRLDAVATLLPGVKMEQLVSRAPSLLAYTPEALERKLGELGELFEGADALAMVRREPALLTYNVRTSLASKVAVYERELPDVDVRKLLAATPRLLSYDVATVVPRKLESLRRLLPGADVPRLVKNVPQLLEYDVDTSLPAKLVALRSLFHPHAAGGPAAPPQNAAQRLATSKLLAGRRPGRSPRRSVGEGSSPARGGSGRSVRRPPPKAGSAMAAAAAAGGGAGRDRRELTTIGLLRLASLDVSVVERRLGRLSALLPEVDTITLVCKQPSLLRRDVDGSLRPRCELRGGGERGRGRDEVGGGARERSRRWARENGEGRGGGPASNYARACACVPCMHSRPPCALWAAGARTHALTHPKALASSPEPSPAPPKSPKQGARGGVGC